MNSTHTIVSKSDTLRRAIMALPEAKHGKHHVWTAEEDAMLLEFWESGKLKKDMARIIGVSLPSARIRYEMLYDNLRKSQPTDNS